MLIKLKKRAIMRLR